ncbi:LIM homeobox transcription factor 1-alpha [Aplochiton taeniatus]
MVEENLPSLTDLTQRAVCAGCHHLIRDKYLLRVNDGLWHEQCMRCAACGDSLNNTCFLRDQKLYCKLDYVNLFAVRCGCCAQAIFPTDLVMRAGVAVFHPSCFVCAVCSCQLQTGDQCVLREGRLLCARDYQHYQQDLTSPASFSHLGVADEDYEEEEEEEDSVKVARRHRVVDGPEHKRPKRPRTILTTQQRRAFKASFEVSSKPCRKVRETLAADTGLSVRIVQVWFQNQRAKMKKLARRQQQQQQEQPPAQEQNNHPVHHTVLSCGNVPSDLEPLQHHKLGLGAVEQQDYDMEPFRQDLTPPQRPGDCMHPKGFKGLYGDLEGDTLCYLAQSDCLSFRDSSLLTPIDRLYFMQDSYFTS